MVNEYSWVGVEQAGHAGHALQSYPHSTYSTLIYTTKKKTTMADSTPPSPSMKLGASKTIKKERSIGSSTMTEHDNDAISTASTPEISPSDSSQARTSRKSLEKTTGVPTPNQEQDKDGTVRVLRSASSRIGPTTASSLGDAQPTNSRLPTDKTTEDTEAGKRNKNAKEAKPTGSTKNIRNVATLKKSADDVLDTLEVDDIKPITLAVSSAPKPGTIEEVELDGGGPDDLALGIKPTSLEEEELGGGGPGELPDGIKATNLPQSSPGPSSAGPSSGPSSPKSQSNREETEETKATTGSIRSSTRSIGEASEAVSTVPEDLRIKARRLFVKVLEKEEGATNAEVTAVALEIESVMFKKFARAPQEYKGKFQELRHNLRDKLNGALRKNVLGRIISPERFVDMTSDELANPSLKEEREKAQEKLTASAMRPDDAQQVTTDEYTCSQCGKNHCTIERSHGRGEQEIMTYVKCLFCKHKWEII